MSSGRKLGSIALLLVLGVVSPRGWAQTAEDYKRSVVRITASDGTIGSGFVVEVSPEAVFLVSVSHILEKGDATPKVEFEIAPRKSYDGVILDTQDGGDGLALLRVSAPFPGGLAAFPPAQDAPAIAQSIQVVGFPHSQGNRFSVLPGSVASRVGSNIGIAAPVGDGNSGGPVLSNGGVVGIVTRGGGGLGTATLASIVKIYLEGNGVDWGSGDRQPPPREVVAAPKPGALKDNSTDGLKYVWVPPGTFEMGCSPGDNDCLNDERPRHAVTISKGFWLGQTEVTVGAYRRFAEKTGGKMPAEPNVLGRVLNAGWGDEDQPIVNVTWDEASTYCEWAGGRLPTEAEWEYTARAGTSLVRYRDLKAIAWYGDNSGNPLDSTHTWDVRAGWDNKKYWEILKENGNRIQRVALKQANSSGLYDALGNVWEWSSDWYGEEYYSESPSTDPGGPDSGTMRVLRGGSWYDIPRDLRTSNRGWVQPVGRFNIIGFRCGREVFP